MGYIKHSLNPRSIVRKVLAAVLLAFLAVVLAQGISRLSFRELVGTVEELSAPNEKLNLLNRVLHELTTLDQMQRAEAITNPRKPYTSFLDQSGELNALIDSLAGMSWDTTQHNRLLRMKDVLAERNQLFFSYLKVKAEMLDNRQFSVQLDTLAAILTDDEMAIDSSLITTRIKTITTYLPDTNRMQKKEHRSFFRKLFGKKEETAVDTPKIRVEEHYSVDFDTLATARQNEALLEVEKIMRELETEQRAQQKRLERQELDLIQANNVFINQLLNILHEVENEELERMRQTNDHAVAVMNQSMSRINLLLLIFGLSAAFFVYLVYIDVSRSNYYKKQLESARDRAEELSQIKQRFLANMSHEIRTPLQSIIGFAEQLKYEAHNRRDAADAIHSASEHLLHIVNEVLDYSRISSGSFTLENEPFELVPLVREVESAMRMQAEQKDLTFLLDLEETDQALTLTGDAFRLRQILYNLLSNAIKFTSRGFIKLLVRTEQDGDKATCTFEVSDSGIGMFPDEIDKIFNQFEQGNAQITRQYGGTGLGLTIVKSIIDAHDGQLKVTSKPGYGSTFTVTVDLPIHSVRGETRTTEHTPPAKSIRAKVLVVDDDPLILRLCSLILAKHNVPHMTLQDPRQCLEPAHYDEALTHIFLDIRMPTINGVELCHRLKERYPDTVRFIALTAHVLKEERDSILAEGFDAILSKPFRESELIDILQADGLTDDTGSPDLSHLRQMTLHDEGLFHSVLSQFLEETSEDIQDLKTQLDQKDPTKTRELVHRLAGRLSQMGFSSLGHRFGSIEAALVAGETTEALIDELHSVVESLEELMSRLRLAIPEHLN